MTFLLLNQTFHPDLSATAQYLSDLARGLVQSGHQATMIASRHSYDIPGTKFRRKELWQGIRILRVASTTFGKRARFGRALDAITFLISCSLRLAVMPPPDIIVVLTSPPLISFVAACFAVAWRCRLCYWVMDFNPDQAIAAGWLRQDSTFARILLRLSLFTFQRSSKIIALDRFMRERIIARGGSPEKIAIIPLWSRDDYVHYDPLGRQRFRAQHGLDEKFVVMYSGNHSACHPLDSLVSAAEAFSSEPDVCFCFVGGGTEWHRLRGINPNMVFLPYQSLDGLSAMLSAADLHVIVMGDPFVGLVHPCKLYNLLKISLPLLYIGPSPSHVTDLLGRAPGSDFRLLTARHGEVGKILQHIRKVRAQTGRHCRPAPFAGSFSKAATVSRLIALLESF